MSLDPVAARRLANLVRTGRLAEFVREAAELEAADLADILAALDEADRLAAVRALPPGISGEALVEMPEEAHAEETLAALDPGQAAEIVEELEDDDAADLLGELEPEEQERILREVEDRGEVERLLRYDEETAGGLMTAAMLTVRDDDTIGGALEGIRGQVEGGELADVYQAFVVDGEGRLRGVIPFRSLVVNPATRPVREVMEDPPATASPDLDQEAVARLMARYNLPSMAVVDGGGRLLGRVTFDDVVDVVEAESTEDLLRFGGVSPDEELGSGWRAAAASRRPWLVLNLLTASAAASVVFLFEDRIAQLALLAVFMPVVAGMGGNAGTQALAVTIRRLALGQIPPGGLVRVVTKEMTVGLANGLLVAVIIGTVAGLLGGPRFGFVVGTAMAGNLFVAGFAGGFVPILLARLGVDPAVASSIFVTTFTDLCGFSLLLGLAGVLLL
ncbi:MAG TPA: magnesium transporter [Gemmatimonadales bacterium]|nr:magnesium transporter [Gemmatimonadales bacterium]